MGWGGDLSSSDARVGEGLKAEGALLLIPPLLSSSSSFSFFVCISSVSSSWFSGLFLPLLSYCLESQFQNNNNKMPVYAKCK